MFGFGRAATEKREATGAIREDTLDGGGHLGGVAREGPETFGSVRNEVRDAADVRAYDAGAAGHGFDDGDWRVVDGRRVQEDIAAVDPGGDFGFRDAAVEPDGVADAEFGGSGAGALEAAVVLVGADHVECGRGKLSRSRASARIARVGS